MCNHNLIAGQRPMMEASFMRDIAAQDYGKHIAHLDENVAEWSRELVGYYFCVCQCDNYIIKN